MNITDIQLCADHFYNEYLRTFYLITTYNNKSFILIGEKSNFPHLMGIGKATYRSHGYARPAHLFNAIISRQNIARPIIPPSISPTSKMYKKAIHFTDNSSIFWNNTYPIVIYFDASRSASMLNNVDIILSDMDSGYMLGWVSNKKVPISENISIEKYCICTWIDEHGSSLTRKERYLPSQNVELIRYVFSFDSDSKLKKKKEYAYSNIQKRELLSICERNRCNLLLDRNNSFQYISVAKMNSIHCCINGKLC